MKKREFLAMGGAVPLALAGCGGNGSGSAPVRLVNASVGYPLLGFMVQTTQATTADVPYGSVSPFETVQAGSVTTTLTVTTGATVASLAASTRTLDKDSRYSLVAYGFVDELKSVLITESTTAPDTGKANINVLNTSVDIGAVDVYISPGTDLSVATLIASSVSGVTQSVFSGVIAPKTGASYYITVVGANSIAKGLSDVRFQSPSPITVVDQQIVTIILTPGASGVLANAIILTQGTVAATTGTVSYLNGTARVRAIAATGNSGTVFVQGTVPSGTGTQAVTILPTTNSPNFSSYFVVSSGAAPTVQVNGTTIANSGTLTAGGDYTLCVYLDNNGQPTSTLVLDDNTAPVSASGVKLRLINLAYNTTNATNPLYMSLSVNSISVASLVGYGSASAYKEIVVPQNVSSVIEVSNGANVLKTRNQPLTAGNIFTEVVAGVGSPGSTAGIQDFFLAAATT